MKRWKLHNMDDFNDLLNHYLEIGLVSDNNNKTLIIIYFMKYRTFTIERGKTARRNQIYFYMPNMFFMLKYVQIWH